MQSYPWQFWWNSVNIIFKTNLCNLPHRNSMAKFSVSLMKTGFWQYTYNRLTSHWQYTDIRLIGNISIWQHTGNTLVIHRHEIFISDIRLALLPVYCQLSDNTLTTDKLYTGKKLTLLPVYCQMLLESNFNASVISDDWYHTGKKMTIIAMHYGRNYGMASPWWRLKRWKLNSCST